ncbi:CsbD family protein [Lysobacter lacus]|uniref:CsbD family protein n=2 Tax=Cognatilysobacter lacus TaxID=1643323 RepID=A0A5D8ZC17_9GAMM|nr:CsbD family protein [Lysobacter lacus]TZF90214.1 CsbD family protein [Lysobacter lacus]
MGHEVKGSIKEATGKLTGDRSKQLEGNVEKNVGKVERSVGQAQDDLRSSERDSRR